MTDPKQPFAGPSLSDLVTRTQYEAWLLEAVYDIVGERLPFKEFDQLIYPPTGGPPTVTIHASANIRLDDWRPGFLKAGAPLVFVTAFKLLDMVWEWILVENGGKPNYRFEQKIAAIAKRPRLPQLLDSRPWLTERLIALYQRLEPLRGTIIHDRHFKSAEGALEVSSSRGGEVGPAVTISQQDLRNLALVGVSVLHYLDGSWMLDQFREKQLRRALDELAHVHQLSSLDQPPPDFMTARVYVPEGPQITCDLDALRRDIAANRVGRDTIFDLRLIVVARDGARATAYRVPWDRLQQLGSKLAITEAELQPYVTATPPDVDPVEAARTMKLMP